MKIGVCVGNNIEKAKLAKDLGYDFVESNCGDIVKMSDAEIEDFKNVGIPVFSANCFIGHRVVGPDRDFDAIEEYVEKLFRNASKLGLDILVFGSSGARKMTDGLTLEGCRSDIVYFLKNFVVPQAEKYNIRVAIEPLRPAECNVINTIEDGISIAKRVDSPYVRVLADVKHMFEQNEDLNKLGNYGEWLIHAHTSNPCPDESTGKKRIYPRINDGFDQFSFLNPLVEAGVEQCAIEADCIEYKEDFEKSIELFNKLLKRC